MSDRYGDDIVIWSERQAELLRRIAAGEPVNEAPDWPNIAEEIEDVGRSQRDSVESHLTLAMLHDLKAEAWPLSPAVPGWRAEARLHRRMARRKFTPGMRQRIDVPGLYADAIAGLPETIDGLAALPVSDVCTVTLEELLSDEP
jgi:Domain of unknown function DUF29